MFSFMRKRLTYANVAVTFALVFAMSGGAYAANKILITSTKQIKPSVLKQLTGKPGANGAPGATGPQGPVGPQGPAGANGKDGATGMPGEPGKEGTNGKNGINGKNGEPGPEGKEGQPWTAGGTLPSGKTETGAWGSFGPVTLPNNGTLEEEKQETRAADISFTLPVEPAVTAEFAGAGATTNCPGTPEKPEAKPGFLCVYLTRTTSMDQPSVLFLAAGKPVAGEASSAGAILRFKVASETGVTTESWGTWAVTAK